MGTLSEHAIRNNYKGACQGIDARLANLSQNDVKGRLILAAPALKVAFTTWYGPKGGQTIRNQLDDDGIGVVDQLKSFLGA